MTLSDSPAVRRRTAEEILAGLDRLRTTGTALPTAPADALRQAARTLLDVAEKPVVVGFAGRLKLGKSELIGTLLGDRFLLPVHELAATGNIVYVRLHQVPRGRPASKAETAIVEFLTREELDSCREEMVASLADSLGGIRWAHELGDLPRPGWSWQHIADWSGNAWQFQDAGLRDRLTELAELYTAELAGGSVLGSNPTLPWQMVEDAGIRLRGAGSRPQAEPFAQVTAESYGGAGIPGRAEELAAVFPLIRRILVDVEVPEDVWPLDRLGGGADVHLIDFPGEGARRSQARDWYLMAREFPLISTLVVFVNGAKPDEGGPEKLDRLYTASAPRQSARRDGILTTVNLFDKLPGGPARPPSGDRLSAGELLTGPLGHAVEAARELIAEGTEDSRLALTSSWIHHEHSGISCGSPQDTARTLSIANGWGALAERLATDDPRRGFLAPALSAVAEDGGIDRLRGLIEKHVHGAGGRERARLLGDAWQALVNVHTELIDAVGTAEVPVIRASDASERQRLRRQLNECARRTEQRSRHPKLVPPLVSGSAHGLGAELEARVTAHAAELVADWPQWELLFQEIGDDCLVHVGGQSGPPGGFPGTSDVFFDSFGDAADRIRDWAEEEGRSHIRAWVRRQDAEGSELAGEIRSAVRSAHQELLEQGHRPTVSRLRRCLEHGWLLDQSPAPLPKADVAPLFPMAVGKVLPWHPRFVLPEVENHRSRALHQVRVMHLRRELTAAVASIGLAAVLEALRSWEVVIRERLGPLAQGFAGNAWVEPLLDAVCGSPDVHNPVEMAAEIKGWLSSEPDDGWGQLGEYADYDEHDDANHEA